MECRDEKNETDLVCFGTFRIYDRGRGPGSCCTTTCFDAPPAAMRLRSRAATNVARRRYFADRRQSVICITKSCDVREAPEITPYREREHSLLCRLSPRQKRERQLMQSSYIEVFMRSRTRILRERKRRAGRGFLGSGLESVRLRRRLFAAGRGSRLRPGASPRGRGRVACRAPHTVDRHVSLSSA